MIKYIVRKPLFLILLLILILFEVLFMGSLRKGIERDMKTVEDMYDSATITFEALPGFDSGGILNFRPHFSDVFEGMEECEKVYKSINCPFSLRKPQRVVGTGWLHGTNDPVWFAGSREVEIEWAEGWEPGPDADTSDLPDWNENDGDIPCIADKDFLSAFGLKYGDHFTAAPYDNGGEDRDKAPDVSFYIIGSFINDTDTLKRNSIIVPEIIFVGNPTILYYWRMMDDFCAYRDYRIVIKPEYNRMVDEVEDKMLATCNRAGIVMHSDIRVLKKAIRPIEQRLKIQKALEGPLEIALAIATAIMAVLVAIAIQDDIFLYIFQGQSRWKTFIKALFSLLTIAAAFAAITFAAGILVLGAEWTVWILSYLGEVIALCFGAFVVTLIRFCYRNLVHFYQTKEG